MTWVGISHYFYFLRANSHTFCGNQTRKEGKLICNFPSFYFSSKYKFPGWGLPGQPAGIWTWVKEKTARGTTWILQEKVLPRNHKALSGGGLLKLRLLSGDSGTVLPSPSLKSSPFTSGKDFLAWNVLCYPRNRSELLFILDTNLQGLKNKSKNGSLEQTFQKALWQYVSKVKGNYILGDLS